MFRQFEYQNAYNKAKYDRISVNLAKGTREKIKLRAAEDGLSVNEYVCRLIESDLNGSRRIQAPDEAERISLLQKWQIPKKYYAAIASVRVETDQKRQQAAAAGQRIAGCVYSIELQPGYINEETGSRLIVSDKTKELRRIIVKTKKQQ